MLHWPAGVSGYPRTASAPAGLIDVAPTILDFLHLPAPASFVGKSQLGALKPGEAAASTGVYSESLYAYDAFHWAPLRSLRQGRYKFIAAPRAELYDLQADPGEHTNLLHQQAAVGAELNNRLNELLTRYAPTAAAPPPAVSPETLARLESLGYVAAAPAARAENQSLPDPKDRLAEFQLYQGALLALEEGHAAAALPKFLALLRQDPGKYTGPLSPGGVLSPNPTPRRRLAGMDGGPRGRSPLLPRRRSSGAVLARSGGLSSRRACGSSKSWRRIPKVIPASFSWPSPMSISA